MKNRVPELLMSVKFLLNQCSHCDAEFVVIAVTKNEDGGIESKLQQTAAYCYLCGERIGR